MASLSVEAKSLSSLTTLAANPPSHPRNPTHVRHEPLVLYIARVPGSRDVFLTPMKPRDKVVSAEDVQSSLYFLHVDQPEDGHLFAPLDVVSGDVQESSHGPAVDTPPPPPPPPHRIPVPSTYPAHGSSAPALNQQLLTPDSLPNAPTMTKRKPVPGALAPRSNAESRYNVENQPGHGPPKPSSVNLDQMLSPDTFMLSRKENEAPMLPPRRYSEQPALPPRPPYPGSPSSYHDNGRLKPNDIRRPELPSSSSSPSHYSSSPRHLGLERSRGPETQRNSQLLGTTLTLIRRDPGSGEQWNVASIQDPPVLEVSSSTLTNPSTAQKKSGAPIYIEVTNPGYSKFLQGSESISDAREGGTPTNMFKRRVWMEGSKYSDRTFGHRKMNSNDSSFGPEGPRSSSESWGGDVAPSTLNPADAPFLSRDNQTYGTIQVSDKRSTFRGYVFLSPWNGRCEFTTGGGGGSLKCKHVLPGPQGAAPSITMPASELRFNLPSTTFMASTPKGEDGSSKRSSFFGRPHNQRQGSSVSDVRVGAMNGLNKALDRLDLSLGQEMAGGGFGGKQAKLGKLIIDDEGFKMVDLLVAANLALWWRAYERVESKMR